MASLFPSATYWLHIVEDHEGASITISAVDAGDCVAMLSVSFAHLAGPSRNSYLPSPELPLEWVGS
jgi:hypothetical protein